MIRNNKQRAVAVKKRDEARRLAAEGDAQALEVYSAFAADLDAEIREFDAISNGYCKAFKFEDLDALAELLVKCRLSRQWTQAQLAAATGVAEQQVQRDEAGGYSKAALWRLAEIIDVLGYSVEGVVRPQAEEGVRWDVKPAFMSAALPDEGFTTTSNVVAHLVGHS